MSSWKEQLDINNIPKHIAVIMDGNGRWAQMHNKPRVFGHRHGVKAVREVTEGAAQIGVKYLTLYAFSTENWNRPALEVNALMMLLVETLNREVKTLNKNRIKLRTIGDINQLPIKTQKVLQQAIQDTSYNDQMTLILALNYSSRWELVQAVKKIVSRVASEGSTPDEIDEYMLRQALDTADYPDPELMIRTSGEQRISNFLLYQLAYAELYFTDKYWPDFRQEDLYKAIVNYQQRERRFGMILDKTD